MVFNARMDIKVVADHITSGGHFGLLTRNHCPLKTDNKFRPELSRVKKKLIAKTAFWQTRGLCALTTTYVDTWVDPQTISLLWCRSDGGWCGAEANNLARTCTRQYCRASWCRWSTWPIRFRLFAATRSPRTGRPVVSRTILRRVRISTPAFTMCRYNERTIIL